MTESIFEVIKYHECGDNSSRCFDLVTAVISSSTDRILKKAEIIVGDHSLQIYECARVQLWKLSDKEMDECITIRRGDILRFNSVCLRNKYANFTGGATTCRQNVQQTTEHKLSKCICDLHHPSMQSISVPRFIKVGAVCGRHIITKAKQGGASAETDWNVVDQVGRWFRETHESNHVDDSNRLHAKRKLRELIAPNLKSDVLVRVLQMDIDEKSEQKYDARGKNVNTEFVQIIINDGDGVETEHDSKVLYVLRSSPLLVKIKECYQRQETFLLRDVLTQKITKNIKPNCTNGEMTHSVILVPSNKTCLELVSQQIPRNRSKRANNGRSSNKDYTSENIRLSLTPVSTQGSFDKIPYSLLHRESDFINKFIAHLSSMRLIDQDISICSMSCLREFSKFFSISCRRQNGNDDFMDQRVILTIHPEDHTEESLQVLAGIDIVAILCGCSDLSHAELISEDHSTFLKSLMSLKVPLEWSLKHNHILNATHVEAVSMPSLDF